MPLVYYNENSPFCSTFLTQLISDDFIPNGFVDNRSVEIIPGSDILPYNQVHLFAGVGGWPFALQLAGWPVNRPVWTGLCPCQPFSNNGKQLGESDNRHLWPSMFRLIQKCRPATIFGEQVASKLGREWLANLFDDLESIGYAVAGADLCAASVGSPQIRQRLYWVADRLRGRKRTKKSVDFLPKIVPGWNNGIVQTGRACCDVHRTERLYPPRVRLVADGLSEDVAYVSAFGNAIVPQLAATFIQAFLQTEGYT